MSTMLRDSGAGAYSKAALVVLAMGSVQREVVGAGVPSGGHLGALHQQVVQQRRGAEPEPVRVEPVLAGGLVDCHQVLDRVLAGADATGGFDADPPAGRRPEAADR